MPICISYLVRPDFSEDSGRSNVRWLMQNIAGIRTLYLSVISPERLKTILYENSNSCSGVCDEISSSDLILRSLWYIVFIGDRFPPLCSKKILFQEAVGEKRQWLAQGSLWRTWKKTAGRDFYWGVDFPNATDGCLWLSPPSSETWHDLSSRDGTHRLKILAPICQVPMWTGLLWAPYGSWKPRVWKPNLSKLTSF